MIVSARLVAGRRARLCSSQPDPHGGVGSYVGAMFFSRAIEEKRKDEEASKRVARASWRARRAHDGDLGVGRAKRRRSSVATLLCRSCQTCSPPANSETLTPPQATEHTCGKFTTARHAHFEVTRRGLGVGRANGSPQVCADTVASPPQRTC